MPNMPNMPNEAPKISMDSEELLLLGLTPKQLVLMANCLVAVVALATVKQKDVRGQVNVAALIVKTQAQARDIGRAQFLAMFARLKALVLTTDIPIERLEDAAFPTDDSQN